MEQGQSVCRSPVRKRFGWEREGDVRDLRVRMDDLTARSPRRGEWQHHPQVWGSGTRTGMRKTVMSFLGGRVASCKWPGF